MCVRVWHCMRACDHLILMSREMINCHQGNLEVALRTVVHNELGQNRSPTNMHLLAMLMHTRPEAAPKVMCVALYGVDYLVLESNSLWSLPHEILPQLHKWFKYFGVWNYTQ